ncbi:hypothetical protein YC2023_094530 [Brassica napus]
MELRFLQPFFQLDLYGLVMCHVDVIEHVVAYGILFWTFVGVGIGLNVRRLVFEKSLINAQISTKGHVLGSRIFDIMP